jgi:hypothetical protein
MADDSLIYGSDYGVEIPNEGELPIYTPPPEIDPELTNPIYSDTGGPPDTTSYNSDGTINPGGTAYSSDLNSGSGLSSSDIAKFFASNPRLAGIAKVLGAVGAGKLADKLFDVEKGPGGYKGGIPTLTASRQMFSVPTTVQTASGATAPRRPGSGGITYFSPTQYLASGQTPTAVQQPVQGGIPNLPAINRAPIQYRDREVYGVPPPMSIADEQRIQDLRNRNLPLDYFLKQPQQSPAQQLVAENDPFYQSAQYKAYQNDPSNMYATADMYYSPYFGQQSSGSAGRAMDKAYEQYKGIAPRQNQNIPAMFDLSAPIGTKLAAGGIASLNGYADGGSLPSNPRGVNDAAFFNSPEYKAFQNNLANITITPDAHTSPYFGKINSGSVGKAIDKAYEQYLNNNQKNLEPFDLAAPIGQGSGFGGGNTGFTPGLAGGNAAVTTTGQYGQLANPLGLYSLGSTLIGNALSKAFGMDKSYENTNIPIVDLSTYNPAVIAENAAKEAAYQGILAERNDAIMTDAANQNALNANQDAINAITAAEAGIISGENNAPSAPSSSDGGGSPVGAGDGGGGIGAGEGLARGGMLPGYAMGGGLGSLGGYSDGGRLLRGPGDGVSDSIPAMIGKRQPARLADGEFVVPARIVSELGNGSTEAGARKLYAMMDRIKKARSKAKNIAADTKADKHLPA